MARRSSISSTTPTSETNIAFFSAGGHSHDGSNSSLIDGTKYSVFDFDQGFIPSNTERAQRQQRNKDNFDDHVRDLLRTAGIELAANSINATNIIAGSITANEIAANTITTNELTSDILKSSNFSYTSGNFSNAGSFFDLSDGAITSENFSIDSVGDAYFRGSITGSTIQSSTLEIVKAVGGDRVFISEGGILLAETGGNSAPILKFDTNSGSYTHTILSDKRLKISSGGSGGVTHIYIGSTTGSTTQGPVNCVATDLQLNGSSVALSGHSHSSYSLTSHTHAYLSTSGGTLNGSLDVNGNLDASIYNRNVQNGTERSLWVNSGNQIGCQLSTYKVKQDIVNLTYGLEDVLKMRPVHFRYINSPHIARIGLIAEELNEIVPESVVDDPDDPDFLPSINYDNLVVPLISAVQQLSRKVDELQSQLDSLS